MSAEPVPPPAPEPSGPSARHRRRPRYSGNYPRRYDEKYKERDPLRYRETVAKVIASGKTPAGSHRPVMVKEVLEVLRPVPGEIAVDCTLGYGGHAAEFLAKLRPGGKLIGLDRDPLELPKTEARLRTLGFSQDEFLVYRSNFAGLLQALASAGLDGADLIFADLGVSSMQLDDPARGFTARHAGPLDMRMNPHQSQSAQEWLAKVRADTLQRLLAENADEPHAAVLAPGLAGQHFPSTTSLVTAIRALLPRRPRAEQDQTIRRVFQSIRIAVNDEFSALEAFLRQLPTGLRPGGRAAILTFHSGEDRRVKQAFEEGRRAGSFVEISTNVLRPSPEERYANPRSASAKLRWARKSSGM